MAPLLSSLPADAKRNELRHRRLAPGWLKMCHASSDGELEAAIGRATALKSDSFKIARQDTVEGFEEMKTRHPGFEERIYKRAWNDAYFAAVM